jgi:hypothetical protein
MRKLAQTLLCGICTVAVMASVACKKSQPEIGTVPGAGKINACSLITKEDAELMMGAGAKKVFHADWNECYIIQATTPDSDTNRPSPEHAFVALRVYTRERWETDKSPNPTSDRAIDGIGDEAIDQVSAIAFRKGDNCFMLSGWRSYLDSAEHPIRDLPNKILSRL